jgi:16S rRNA C1402 N4-methylase RsmH
LYWSIIRPIVTYACETWVLKETIKNKLMVFERKVLRKSFGPTKERCGTVRIKTNDELVKLKRHKNTINYIKAQKSSLFGHLHRMQEERMVKKSV